jgi:hypothetical protein
MPLSPAGERRHLHTRRIELNGYEREDGLFDVEAQLVDTKGYVFENSFRGEIVVGEPLHGMWIRITVDEELVIHALEAVTDHSPFPSCPEAAASFQRVVGLKIGRGWMERVKERVGGVEGCTHLLELLPPLATAAFQTIAPLRMRRRAEDPDRRPLLIDSCHGWRAGGEAIAVLHPKWHRKE